MRRFLLFAGYTAIAKGGMKDFKGSSSSLTDANSAYKGFLLEGWRNARQDWEDDLPAFIKYKKRITWYHIYDSKENKILNA